jgi:DNA-binding NarL/FixJ family response regulator
VASLEVGNQAQVEVLAHDRGHAERSGQTSREIASDLSLSPRTVEMHVHNVLVKLDCRSRVDIARRAGELGLLS